MTQENKEPDYDEASRCLAIRCQSRRGPGHPNQEDHDFCVKMFEKYPEWYRRTEKYVFEQTKPFGAY